MGTFISEGADLFNLPECQCDPLIRKRSHGRLKTCTSLTDIRAFSHDPVQRQKHNLTVINNCKTTYGNYVPVKQLLRILGVPDNRVLLDKTLHKLAIIDDIVNGKTGCVSLTSSEEEIREVVYGDESGDIEVIKNLRCLVGNLMEQYDYYMGVKCERDNLRCQLEEESEMYCSRMQQLETERNCLKQQVKALDGIEEKVARLKELYDGAVLSSIPQPCNSLWDTSRVLCDWELDQLEEKVKEADFLREEVKDMKIRIHSLNKAEAERDCLLKEMEELKCTVADQDDEIKFLIDQTEQLSSSLDVKQEKMRSCVSGILNDLNEKIQDILCEGESMSACDAKMVEEFENIRVQIKSCVSDFVGNKVYHENDMSLNEVEINRLQRLGMLTEIDPCLYDPNIGCDFVCDMLVSTKRALDSLLVDYGCLMDQYENAKRQMEQVCSGYDDLNQQLLHSQACYQRLQEDCRMLKKEVAGSQEAFGDCDTLKAENDELKEQLAALEDIAKKYSEVDFENESKRCELMYLSDQLANLKETEENLTRKNAKLTKEINRLLQVQAECNDTMQNMERMCYEHAQLSNSNAQMQSELDELRERFAAGDQQLTKCNEKCDILGNTNAELQDQLDSLEVESNKLKGNFEKLTKAKDSLETQLQRTNIKLESEKRTNNDLLMQVSNVTDELTSTKDNLAATAKGLEAAEEEIGKLNQKISEGNEAAEQLKVQIEELKRDNSDLTAVKGGLEEDVRKLESKLFSAENEKKRDEKFIKELTKNKKDLEMDIAALNKRLSDTVGEKNILEEGMAAMKASMEEMGLNKEGLENKCKSLQCSLDSTSEELYNTVKSMKELEKNNKNLISQVEHEKKVNAKLSDDIKQMSVELDSMTNVNGDIKQELNQSKSELMDLRMNLEEKDNELRQCRGDHNDVHMKLTSTVADMTSLKDTMKKLQKESADFKNIQDGLMEALESLKKEKIDLNSQLVEAKEDNQKLLSEYAQSENQLTAAKEEIKELISGNVKLQGTIERLQERVDKMEFDLKREISENKKRGEELEKAKDKAGDLEQQLKASEKKLTAANVSLNKCKDENVDLKKEIEGLEKMKSALGLKLESSRSSTNMNKDMMKQGQKVVDELKDENAKLNVVLDRKQRELDSIRNQLGDVISKYEKLETKCSILDERLERCMDERSQLKTDKTMLSDDILARDATISSLEATLRETKDSLADTKREAKSLFKKSEELDEQIKDVKEKLKVELDRTFKLSRQVDDLSTKVGVLEPEKEYLSKTVKELQQETSKLKETIEKLNLDLSTAGNNLATEREEKFCMQGDLAGLKEKILELNETINTQEIMIQNTMQEANEFRVETVSLREKTKGLEDTVQEQNATIRGLEFQVKQQSDIILDLKGKLDELKTEKKSLESEVKDLERTVAGKTGEIRTLNEKIEAFEKEKVELNERIKDAEKKIVTLGDEIASLNQTIADLEMEKGQGDADLAIKEEALLSKIDELKKAKDDLKNERNEKALLDKKLKSTAQELSKLKTSEMGLKKEVENLKAAMSSQAEDLKTCAGKNDNLAEIIKTQTLHAQETGKLLREQQSLNSDLTAQLNNLKKQVEKLKENYKKAINDRAIELEKSKTYELEQNKLNEKIMEQDQNITALNKTMRELKNKIYALEDEIASLKEEISDKACEIQALQEDLSNAEGCLENMRSSSTVDSEKEKLMNDLKEEKEKSMQLRAELSGVTGELNKCKKTIASLETQVKELETGKEKAEQEAFTCSEELTSVKGKMKFCEVELKSEKGKVSSMEKKLQFQEEDLTGALEGKRKCEMTLKKVNGEMSSVKKKLKDLQKELKELDRSRSTLENQLIMAKNSNETLKLRIAKLEEELDLTSKEKQQTWLDLVAKEKEVENKKEELKILTNELANVEKGRKALENEKLVLLRDNSSLKNKVDGLERTASDLQNQLAALEEALDRKGRDELNLKREMQCAKDQVEQWKALSKGFEDEVRSLKNLTDDLTTEKAASEARLKQLEGDGAPDTKLNVILKKVLKSGWDNCDLEELSEVHQSVTMASNKLVAQGKAAPSSKAPVTKIEPRMPPLDPEKKELLIKVSHLQKEIEERQEEAKKRTCALTKCIQQYQQELFSIRDWQEKNLKETESSVDEATARESQLMSSRLSHYLDMAECERKKSQKLECQLQQAQEKINTVKDSVVKSPIPKEGAEPQTKSRKKVSFAAAPECPDPTDVLLDTEKRKTACLSYQLSLVQEETSKLKCQLAQSTKRCGDKGKGPREHLDRNEGMSAMGDDSRISRGVPERSRRP